MALLNIDSLEVYRFRLPFARPVNIGQTILTKREGFILILKDRQGRQGLGEIAPLPGWDPISLEECRKELSILLSIFKKNVRRSESFIPTVPAFGILDLPHRLSPHTLFGLEGALLCLGWHSKRIDPPDVFTLPVNGLFTPTPENKQAADQMDSLAKRGFQTIKIKIGRLPEDLEIRQILRLVDTFGGNLRLRLDANRSLTKDAYHRYSSALGHLQVEYIEEPLHREAKHLPLKSPWPIALDESLPDYLDFDHPNPSDLPGDVHAVILKPGRMAGLSGMMDFIPKAKRQNIHTVLSSGYNTGIGIFALGLTAQISGLSTPCGFDTLQALQTDVLKSSPAVSGGKMLFSRTLLTDASLNLDVLSREVL